MLVMGYNQLEEVIVPAFEERPEEQPGPGEDRYPLRCTTEITEP
jgi:hypothetical protein